jgi:hypothetical protein
MQKIILPVLLLCASFLQAQVFMRNFENAASLSLGSATLAYPDLSIGTTNEAQLGLPHKLGFLASTAIPYGIGDWQSVLVQGYANIGSNSGVGIDINHGGTEDYLEQRARLQYGRRLGQKFYLGASLDALRVSQQEYGSSNTATFSIGMMAQALPKVWIAARVSNPLQQKLSDEILPTTLRIGACWQASNLFLLLLETEKIIDRPVQLKAGAEYRPTPLVAIRIGTRNNPARIGFGAGLRLKNGLRIDLGSEWHPVLGITPSAAIAWSKDKYHRNQKSGPDNQ